MSRLDVIMAKRMEVERQAVLIAVYGGLEAAVLKAGGELSGISVKLRGGDCLLTLRARFPGGEMIGFVGAADLPDVLRKATSEAGRDAVKWREDKWRGNGG